MKIGEKTLHKGGELLTNSLLTYQKSINEAFLKCEGEGMIAENMYREYLGQSMAYCEDSFLILAETFRKLGKGKKP
jgi:hypothetical protein